MSESQVSSSIYWVTRALTDAVGDKASMERLVQVTSEGVSNDIRLAWDIAQRASMQLNILASIRSVELMPTSDL